MKAKLFTDNEPAGHVEGIDRDTSVIIYRDEFYVFNAHLKGFERAKAQRVSRIEWTPPLETTAKEPLLPME